MIELDFLNVGGKEENGGSHDDAAFSVGSAKLWPLLDYASPLQQFTPFKTLREPKPKNVFFNPISATEFQHISAAETFESNRKTHVVQASQFAIRAYQSQDRNIYPPSTPHVNDDVLFSSVLHRFIANTMISPFSKVKDSSSSNNLIAATVNQQPSGSDVLKNTSLVGSEVEANFPRTMSKPATASGQLTIFYAGSINVYDDVPCDKAQNVLAMASEGCKAGTNTSPEAQEPPLTEGSISHHLGVARTSKMANSRAILSDLSNSNSLSLASRNGHQSYVPTDDKVGEKTMEISSQIDPSEAMNASKGAVTAAILLPIAVPQARKASLARFLVKRKERASSWIPYSCGKKAFG